MRARTFLPALFAALAFAAPASAQGPPTSLIITPNSLIGGTVDQGFGTGTVTIAEPAPPNSNWPVSINPSSSAIVITSGPNNNISNLCYVPPNSNSCSFNVRAGGVSQPLQVTVSATQPSGS